MFRKPFSLNASSSYRDDPSAQAQGLAQWEWQEVRVQELSWRHDPETPAILLEQTVAWDFLALPKTKDL